MIAGSDEVYLRGITAFRDHLAITERVNGLDQIRLRTYDGQRAAHPLPRGELYGRRSATIPNMRRPPIG